MSFEDVMKDAAKQHFRQLIYGVADTTYQAMCAALDEDEEKAKILMEEANEYQKEFEELLGGLNGK